MPPFLSIVIATYDVARELEACLASISAQTLSDVEVLVSDGGSTDGTVEIARRFAPLVQHVRSGPDTGIYDAWNQVIPLAKASWVLFLGADDALLGPNVLAAVRDQLEVDAVDAGLVAFPCWITGHRERMLFKSASAIRSSLERGQMGFAHTALLHHRSLFDRHGEFDASFKIAGDLEFLLRVKNCPIHAYPAPVLTEMAGEGVSNARRFIRLRHAEAMRARRMHGLPGATLKQRYGMALDHVRAWQDARRPE